MHCTHREAWASINRGLFSLRGAPVVLRQAKAAFTVSSSLIFKVILYVHTVKSQIACKACYDKCPMLHFFLPLPGEALLSALIHYFRIYLASIINGLLMLVLDLLVLGFIDQCNHSRQGFSFSLSNCTIPIPQCRLYLQLDQYLLFTL